MIFVRMAESAETLPFTFECANVQEAIALARVYVNNNDRRIAEVVNTNIPVSLECAINYTSDLSISDCVDSDIAYCYLFNTTL